MMHATPNDSCPLCQYHLPSVQTICKIMWAEILCCYNNKEIVYVFNISCVISFISHTDSVLGTQSGVSPNGSVGFVKCSAQRVRNAITRRGYYPSSTSGNTKKSYHELCQSICVRNAITRRGYYPSSTSGNTKKAIMNCARVYRA
jgi:hypothetical protein